ncbi:MAG: cupin domain-containing protein, partial [Actinomycetota bacterium]
VFNGTERRMKVTSVDTDGHLPAFVSTYPVGVPHPLHIHHDAIESFYILDGAARFHVDGESREAERGSFLSVPCGVAHGFVALVEGTRALVLFTPSAMEGFWEELAGAAEAGALDGVDVAGLYQRHSLEPVGPLPDSSLESD